MIGSVHHWLAELAMRRQLRIARRKLRVIEAMDLPEELKQAAMNRVLRHVEHRLDRYACTR